MSEKELGKRSAPVEVIGDTKDLYVLISELGARSNPTEEARLITPEEAARLCAGNDDVAADIELNLIHRWIIEESVPFIRHSDGSIKLPMEGFLMAMGELTGIDNEVTNMLQPSAEDLAKDAEWRPDWLM
jgi:hypothetical protein